VNADYYGVAALIAAVGTLVTSVGTVVIGMRQAKTMEIVKDVKKQTDGLVTRLIGQAKTIGSQEGHAAGLEQGRAENGEKNGEHK
jgi:hypothetical protein